MELIEGAPIGEYCASLREKGTTFTESRVWSIFIQVRDMFCFCFMLHSQVRVVIFMQVCMFCLESC